MNYCQRCGRSGDEIEKHVTVRMILGPFAGICMGFIILAGQAAYFPPDRSDPVRSTGTQQSKKAGKKVDYIPMGKPAEDKPPLEVSKDRGRNAAGSEGESE